MTELEKDLAKVVKDKAKHPFVRGQALKILYRIKLDKLKQKAKQN